MSQPVHDGGFQALPNFRDIAVTVNTHLNRRLLRESLLYRSARPDECTLADRDRLLSHYQIHTILDLRSKTEHHRAATKRAADSKIPTLLQSNAALAEPVQIPGVRYREVRVTGSGFERFMLKQLGWSSFFKLILLHVGGWRMEAVSILGKEVMNPRGLLGLAADTLDASGPEIAEALRVLLEPEGLPLLVHCTQGKDRTGLIVALALLICKVPVEAIEYDYELTDEKLVGAEREDRLKEIREMGLSEEFGRTVRGFVPGIKKHLDEKYGGLDAYLDQTGFGADERTAIREKLLY